MSITREQAAAWFETMHPPSPSAREMYRMAAAALRPVSRERIKQAWRGEWIIQERKHSEFIKNALNVVSPYQDGGALISFAQTAALP